MEQDRQPELLTSPVEIVETFVTRMWEHPLLTDQTIQKRTQGNRNDHQYKSLLLFAY